MKDESTAKIVSEHIKQFISKTPTRKKLTQKEAAEALGISLATLKRYIICEKTPSKNYAKAMETATGIIYPYWMGETECKTWIEYYAEIEKCEYEGMVEYEQEIAEEVERRRILFSRLGYRYESLEDDNKLMTALFLPVSTQKITYADAQQYYIAAHPHKLTSLYAPEKSYYFDQKELNDLLNQLGDIIAFACFKKDSNLHNRRTVDSSMTTETSERERRIELMLYWVIADEDTGDIIGLKPGAPVQMVEEYQKYLGELNNKEAEKGNSNGK